MSVISKYNLLALSGTAIIAIAALAGSCFSPASATPAIDHRDSHLIADSESSLMLVNITSNTSHIGEGAQDFVQDMGQKAIGFLGSTEMSRDQKQAAFRNLLQNTFDMKTIGRFSLGRYWRTSTPAQRDKYQELFREMVTDVYSARFTEYKGHVFSVRKNRFDGKKDTIVTSFVVPDNGPEVQVDWRVRYKNSQYKIVDVIVEGVSMSVTQRSDFSAVIQRGGGSIDALLAYLKGE